MRQILMEGNDCKVLETLIREIRLTEVWDEIIEEHGFNVDVDVEVGPDGIKIAETVEGMIPNPEAKDCQYGYSPDPNLKPPWKSDEPRRQQHDSWLVTLSQGLVEFFPLVSLR